MVTELRRKLRSVRLSAPSYRELVNLHYVKEIYSEQVTMAPEQNFRVFKQFCDLYSEINEEKDVKIFMSKVNSLRKDLKFLGIKPRELFSEQKILGPQTYKVVLKILASWLFLVPFFIFFLPIRYVLLKIAETKREAAVSNSVVKGAYNIVIIICCYVVIIIYYMMIN